MFHRHDFVYVDIDGDEYIAVVTGCKSNDERYASVHKLIKQIK